MACLCRMADLYCLSADPASSKLACHDWSAALAAAVAEGGGGEPLAERAAHCLELVHGRLYIVGGYGFGKTFIPDLWQVALGPAAPGEGGGQAGLRKLGSTPALRARSQLQEDPACLAVARAASSHMERTEHCRPRTDYDHR